jgi:hypothetical protein
MIKFVVDETRLLLSYTPERDPEWITRKFDQREPITLRRSFHLQAEDLHSPVGEEEQDETELDEEYVFVLGDLSGEYFKINSRIVATTNTFYFHMSMPLSTRLFVAYRDISILRKIDELVSEDVYVGGARDDAMPESAYAELIDKFPNRY